MVDPEGATVAARAVSGGATESGGATLEGSADLLRTIGRYDIFGELATGGMATVHLGRLRGAGGFHKIVAIKRLHPQYAKDPEFVRMFEDEARLAARIQDANVVATLDVVSEGDEIYVVMEYVVGETIARLVRSVREDTEPTRVSSPTPVFEASGRKSSPLLRLPTRIVCAIMRDALRGLHAAHEAKGEGGQPLQIVHRDVSPQNILVGVDGRARVLDFGVAKAAGFSHTTQSGVIKGKLGYMSPEQVYGERLDRRADVYSAGVVLWELLTGRRLFAGFDEKTAIGKVLNAPIEAPGLHRPELSPDLDEVVMRALERDVTSRYPSAQAFADALEGVGSIATAEEVGAWVKQSADDSLAHRAELVAQIERVAVVPIAASPVAPKKPRYVLGAVLLGLVALLAWRGLTSSTSVEKTVPTAETTSTALGAGTVVSAATSDSTVVPAISASAPPASGGTSTAMAVATVHPVVPRPTVKLPPKRPTLDCNPPYTVDARGHKRYKRGCFR